MHTTARPLNLKHSTGAGASREAAPLGPTWLQMIVNTAQEVMFMMPPGAHLAVDDDEHSHDDAHKVAAPA